MATQNLGYEGQRQSRGRGFAGMDKDRQREIASKGGRSVPDKERSFSKNPQLAALAGRRGGQRSHGGGRRAGQ